MAKNVVQDNPLRIGKYTIEAELLKNEGGARYLSRETATGKQVIVEVAGAAEAAARFERLAQHDHPATAHILETGRTTDDRPYLALTLPPGRTLADRLVDREAPALTTGESLILARRTAAALQAAHDAGVVHPDLRPQNVYLGDDQSITLLGFGSPIRPAVQNGETLDFAPLEANIADGLSIRGNVYSLGVLLYTLLCGHEPRLKETEWDIFTQPEAPTPQPLEEAKPGLAAETYRLVRNCLWRQAWSRFDNMDEAMAAIDAAIHAESGAGSSKSLPATAAKTAVDRIWLIAGGIVLLVILLISGLLLFGDRNPVEDAGSAPALMAATNGAPATETPTIAATATGNGRIVVPDNIDVLGPDDETEVGIEETITFTWRWPLPLVSGQTFNLYAFHDGRSIWQQVVTQAVDGSDTYRVTVAASDISDTPATILWKLQLEDDTLNRALFQTGEQALIILSSTPTPTATSSEPTATPTATATATPTVSPTSTCVPALPNGWARYTIQAEDTLFDLATRTGTTTERLLAVNCFTADTILSVGQSIFIPPLPLTSTPTPSPEPPPTDGGGSGGGSDGAPPPPPTSPPSPPTPTPPNP